MFIYVYILISVWMCVRMSVQVPRKVRRGYTPLELELEVSCPRDHGAAPSSEDISVTPESPRAQCSLLLTFPRSAGRLWLCWRSFLLALCYVVLFRFRSWKSLVGPGLCFGSQTPLCFCGGSGGFSEWHHSFWYRLPNLQGFRKHSRYSVSGHRLLCPKETLLLEDSNSFWEDTVCEGFIFWLTKVVFSMLFFKNPLII